LLFYSVEINESKVLVDECQKFLMRFSLMQVAQGCHTAPW